MSNSFSSSSLNLNQSLGRARQLLQQGNLQAALAQLSSILQQQPGDLEARYLSAVTLFRLGDLNNAEQHLLAALENHPKDLRCLNSLGGIYGHTQQSKKGLDVYQRCLDLEPHNPQFLYAFASMLVLDQQKDEAVSYFEKAIEQGKDWVEPYLALAKLHTAENRHEQSLEVLERAVAAGLVSDGLITAKSIRHAELGQKDQAIETVKQGLAQQPNNLKLLGELTRLDYQLADQSVMKQLSSVNPAGLDAPNRFHYHAVRSRCHRVEKQASDEFSDLIEAHRYFRQINRFHLQDEFYFDHKKKLAAIPECCMKSSESLESMAPIFVLGVPRSGSTLVENILCAGETVLAKGEEVGAFSTALDYLLKPENQNETLGGAVEKIYRSIDLLTGEEGRFTDKSLENVLFIEQLLRVFPKAKIIYCDRNPVSSIVSIMRNFMSQLSWAHELDSILRYFDLCFQAIEEARQKYPTQIYSISYEQLVADPEGESKALFEFCELPWSPECLAFHKKKQNLSRTSSNLQIRKGVNKEGLGSYPELKSFFEQALSRYDWLSF